MELMELCRTCLSSTTNKNISELRTRQHDGTYSDVILFCLNIKVEEDSKVTTKLCLKCFNKIMSFYKFKLLAIKNDAYLKTAESEGLLKSEIFPPDDNVKYENVFSYTSDVGDNNPIEIKVEQISKDNEMDGVYDNECVSDNECLSVIKKIKYEFITEDLVDETKENVTAPTKKKRVKRSRLPKPKEKKTQKSKTQPVAQVCEECGKTVKNLKDHSLQHLPPGERIKFPCKSCDKLFATVQARNKHNKIKHLGIKYTCPICNKKVVSLTAHNRLTHNKMTLPYECVSCGKRYISPSALAMHASMHTRDRPFVCDKCDDATFRSKLCLELHRRRVHEKETPHMCQFCSKGFFQKHHLQVHLRSHTKEKPYQCPDCDKSFSSRSILTNHRTIHSHEKRFECTLCDMSFARSGYLRNHMLSHTKEKRFSCKYCGVKFGRSDHRKRHEHTAHERHSSNLIAKVEAGSETYQTFQFTHRAKSNNSKQKGDQDQANIVGSYEVHSVDSAEDVYEQDRNDNMTQPLTT